MKTLGILSLLGFLFGLLSNFIPFLGIINIIIAIIILIILFSALGNAKEVAYALNNRLLHEFRSKIRSAYILFVIGMLFMVGPLIGLQTGAPLGMVIGFIVIGVIILIIAAILRIQGWGRLQRFFQENGNILPANIGADAETGAKFLKIGAILFLTIILMFIGFILEVIGYFKLSALKNMSGTPAAQPAARYVVASAPAAAAPASKKFCPNCGSPVTGTEKFCSACGSEL